MPNLSQQYEVRNRANIVALNKRVAQTFQDAIAQLTLTASAIPFNGQIIALDQFPALQQQINQVIQSMGTVLYAAVVSGISASWDLSNEKNDILVDRRLADATPTPAASQVLYDPNGKALTEFIDRKEKGLDLSQRVYKQLDLFGPELERGLLVGIADGQSAAEMTQDLRQYLKYPDKLFRRVRDEEGKLRLSKPAQDFHPGQGVYRSSYKNALRLGATETNMSYRKADNTRWGQLPFVVGYDIKLSGSHRKCDVCNKLAGAYPKDFVFIGWHPQCLCYMTPRLLTDKEYSSYEDEILGIGKFDGQAASEIKDTPEAFQDYLEKSKEQINGWSNTPYWVRDNPGYTASLQE
ncbi:MAG TPA: hypothetical protein VGM31_14300 [Puia sp.]|jgi:hypothetical protein